MTGVRARFIVSWFVISLSLSCSVSLNVSSKSSRRRDRGIAHPCCCLILWTRRCHNPIENKTCPLVIGRAQHYPSRALGARASARCTLVVRASPTASRALRAASVPNSAAEFSNLAVLQPRRRRRRLRRARSDIIAAVVSHPALPEFVIAAAICVIANVVASFSFT